MRSPYSLIFNQQQKIQFQVAKKYGYSIPQSSLSQSKISQINQKTAHINRNIKPLEMQKDKPILSLQHQRLLKEIADNQQQKKMRKKLQQRNQDNFNIINVLNERIREYNKLIDHKNIKENQQENDKKLLKYKKSQVQLILQEINGKNKQLQRNGNEQKQKQINKNITELYKKYKQKMQQQKKSKQKKRLHNTLMTRQIHGDRKRSKSYSISQSVKKRNNSQNISNTQYKIKFIPHNQTTKIIRNQYENQQNNMLNPNKITDEFNMQQPYIHKQEIKKVNEIQRRQETNKQLLQMYRGKISQVSRIMQLRERKKLRQQKNKKNNKQSKLDLNFEEYQKNNPFNQLLQKGGSKYGSKQLQKDIQQIKIQRKTQHKYFSSYLQKRNRKFKKPWGNKILIKYDSQNQAKQMLQGTPNTTSPQKTQFFPSHTTSLMQTNNAFHLQSPQTSTFRVLNRNLSQDDRMIIQSMEQQKNDEKLYQVMCKNQKVNLFLKSKKKVYQ